VYPPLTAYFIYTSFYLSLSLTFDATNQPINPLWFNQLKLKRKDGKARPGKEVKERDR